MQVKRYGANALLEAPNREDTDQGGIGSNFSFGYLNEIQVEDGRRRADMIFMVALFISVSIAISYGIYSALSEASKMLPPFRFQHH